MEISELGFGGDFLSISLIGLSKHLKSFVYTNSVSNGNFIDTTGWVASGCVLAASSNILSVTGNGTIAIPLTYQNTNTPIVVGNKLYAQAKISVTNANCSGLRLQLVGSGLGSSFTVAYQATPTQNTVYTLSGSWTVLDGHTGNIRINLSHQYANAATSNGKVMTAQNVFAIDLTALFGAGNEPSAADCANIFRFVDGTKQPSFSNVLAT